MVGPTGFEPANRCSTDIPLKPLGYGPHKLVLPPGVQPEWSVLQADALSALATGANWWRWPVTIPLPLRCKRSALPFELPPFENLVPAESIELSTSPLWAAHSGQLSYAGEMVPREVIETPNLSLIKRLLCHLSYPGEMAPAAWILTCNQLFTRQPLCHLELHGHREIARRIQPQRAEMERSPGVQPGWSVWKTDA